MKGFFLVYDSDGYREYFGIYKWTSQNTPLLFQR